MIGITGQEEACPGVRIIVATDVTVGGGVDKYVLALLDAFRRHGHDVKLLFEKSSASRAGVAAAALGWHVVPLPLYRQWYSRDEIESTCRSWLETARPDGIHIVTGSPRSCLGLRSVASGLGIAFAITESQVSQRVRLSAAQQAEIRASYAGAIAVVFVTSGNRATMADVVGLAGARPVVINNGVELGRIAPYRKAELRPRVPARIISVARLAPEKSLATLVTAISLLPADLINEVNIYGDGPARPELADEIDKMKLADRVFLRGWTADVLPLLRRHDLFVLPSIAEGMPYALLEAMAVGLPVVCTDVPGMVEALAGGEAGLIVPQSDPEALATGIRDSVQRRDRTEERARMAMWRIHRYYDLQASMDRTVQLWEDWQHY